MSQNEIHLLDSGTVFTMTLYDGSSVFDISGATGVAVVFQSPVGTSSTVSAHIVGSGTSGAINYTTTSTTFPVDGTWKVQAVVTFATSKFYSDINSFRVYPNLT